MKIRNSHHEHICSRCDREVKHYLKQCGDPKVILCAKCLAERFSERIGSGTVNSPEILRNHAEREVAAQRVRHTRMDDP
jgi:hypothetical protein